MYRHLGIPYPTVTDDAIQGFFGDYRWLSNHYLAEIEVEHLPGMTFASVEHAYMASKTEVLEEIARLTVEGGLTSKEAKAYGRTVTLRPGWELKKHRLMGLCVKAKFEQHKDLAQLLLATGYKYLEETNDWGDKIWGVCNGEGRNDLGHILMGIRSMVNSAYEESAADAAKSELEYLRYFYARADFGPAHEDVVDMINQAWVQSEAGREVPEGYALLS